MTFDLSLYKPQKDYVSDKYSANLYRWVRQWQRRYKHWGPQPAVAMMSDISFDPAASLRRALIGFQDDGWFVGAQVSRILCDPFPKGDIPSQHIWAWMPKDVGPDITKWFWPEYQSVGRCIFDREHSGWLSHDEGRFDSLNEQHRWCRWCGHEEVAAYASEVRTRKEWRAVA